MELLTACGGGLSKEPAVALLAYKHRYTLYEGEIQLNNSNPRQLSQSSDRLST